MDKPSITIITAIHNGLAVNEIFYEYIKKYTYYPFELIIIDNLSTDGSREFFMEKGANVIVNKVNYSYPVSQNQGISVAKGSFLFFLNNDLVVGPNWDKLLIDIATKHSLDILSASGIENMGNYDDTRAIGKQWKRIKYPLSLLGYNRITLRLMFSLMYRSWERFSASLLDKNKDSVVEGIVGDNVMLTPKAVKSIGLWDERLQQADFDLFMRSKQRSILVGDVKPCHIALGVYMHHFGRMTMKYGKHKPTPFADKEKLITIQEKWSAEEVENYHPNNATLRKKEAS